MSGKFLSSASCRCLSVRTRKCTRKLKCLFGVLHCTRTTRGGRNLCDIFMPDRNDPGPIGSRVQFFGYMIDRGQSVFLVLQIIYQVQQDFGSHTSATAPIFTIGRRMIVSACAHVRGRRRRIVIALVCCRLCQCMPTRCVCG